MMMMEKEIFCSKVKGNYCLMLAACRITPRPQLRLCSATSVSHTLLFRKYVRSCTRGYLHDPAVSDGVWTRGLETVVT